jgi:peptidoglycan/LPS O-acetylase OafA/YrhL
MKKSYLVLVISILVLATTIFWLFSSDTGLTLQGMAQFGIILVLVGFGMYFGLSRLNSVKRGEPAEDEFSRRILQKASSVSYYISLYMWLAVMYFSDRIKMETHSLIGTGIMGMAVIFFISWIYYKIWGTKNV